MAAMTVIKAKKAMKTFKVPRTDMKKVMKRPSNKTMPAARQGGGNATVYKLKAGKKVSQ
jgi:hypothetical protein